MSNQPDDVYICPFCMEKMQEDHRYMPPSMSGRIRIISLKWICSKGDGKGNRHIVEIHRPYQEQEP